METVEDGCDMKVAVITRHAVFNYGSLLQTIATQRCIEDLGCECVVIDYQRLDEDYHKITDVLLANNKRWNRNIATKLLYKTLQSPKFLIMGKHFEVMREGRIKLTRRYESMEELKANKPEADIYLTGSDQVWGPIGAENYDPAYFLDFLGEKDKRVSYAASFGKTDFTPELKREMRRLLKAYDFISVRESSAVDIISDMGIKDVYQVLDPTLLLNSDYWDDYIEGKFPQNYILIYQLHNNPKMMEYAYAMAKRTRLQLVTMSSIAQHLIHMGSKHVFLPTLGQWLGYIKNADFMITDSFHGTAFAINFNTAFVNILPEGTATRNQSILELTGLENRIVRDYEDFSFYEKRIDFSAVNEQIFMARDVSFQQLRAMLDC